MSLDAARLGRKSLSRRRQRGRAQAARRASRRDARSGDRRPPLIELDGRLVGEAQKTLGAPERRAARLRAAEIAGAQLDRRRLDRGAQGRSRCRSACSRRPADSGSRRCGFRNSSPMTASSARSSARLGDIAESVKRESGGCWARPASRRSLAAQYDNLPDELLDLYTRDFIAAWREALSKLRMKKLLADKPQYSALSAISAPTSPLKQLLESIRDETALTRERPKPPPAAGSRAAADRMPSRPPSCSSRRIARPARASRRSSSRSTSPSKATASAQADRRPHQQPERDRAEPGRCCGNPAGGGAGERRLAEPDRRAEEQRLAPAAAVLRHAARRGRRIRRRCRQPRPPGNSCSACAIRSLPYCQQTIVQPLSVHPRQRSGSAARGFRPAVQPERHAGRVLQAVSGAACRHVEARMGLAAGQRGGALVLAADAARIPARRGDPRRVLPDRRQPADGLARGEAAGDRRRRARSSKSAARWSQARSIGPARHRAPGFGRPPPPPPRRAADISPVIGAMAGPSPRTAISVTNDQTGQPSVLERTGPWSLFRMLEAGSLRLAAKWRRRPSSWADASCSYQITTGSMRNPLNLAPLREFRCPSGI